MTSRDVQLLTVSTCFQWEAVKHVKRQGGLHTWCLSVSTGVSLFCCLLWCPKGPNQKYKDIKMKQFFIEIHHWKQKPGRMMLMKRMRGKGCGVQFALWRLAEGFPCNIHHQVARISGDPWTSPVPDHKRNIPHCRTMQPMALDQEERSQLGPKMHRDLHPGLINLWWTCLRGCLTIKRPKHPSCQWQPDKMEFLMQSFKKYWRVNLLFSNKLKTELT